MAGKKREKQKTANYINDEIEAFNIKRTPDASSLKFHKKFKNEKQKTLYKKILDNRIMFIGGPAGTGKSYVALMAALEFLTNDNYNIKHLQLTKPIIEAAKSIGFLKGTLEDKTGPYFDSFYDNIEKIIGKSGLKFLKDNLMISETIVNFIRGNTFGDQNELGETFGHVCILDEAQNMTVGEIKTFISRMGEGTRLIILGDEDQMDIKLKPGDLNGLQWCFEHLQDIDTIDHFRFDEDDIVREKLLIEIMKRFKRFEKF